MTREFMAAIYATVGVVVVLAIGFSLPPLVSREGPAELTQQQQVIAKNEYSFCRANLNDVNCSCFSRRAAHVLTQDQPRITGFVYEDRSNLAHSQAGNSC
jgi:hypothetical protein